MLWASIWFLFVIGASFASRSTTVLIGGKPDAVAESGGSTYKSGPGPFSHKALFSVQPLGHVILDIGLSRRSSIPHELVGFAE